MEVHGISVLLDESFYRRWVLGEHEKRRWHEAVGGVGFGGGSVGEFGVGDGRGYGRGDGAADGWIGGVSVAD